MGISFSIAIAHHDTVRYFPLEERLYTVGRDPFSDIFIGDPVISRLQLTLHPAGDSVRVTMNPRSRNSMVRNGAVRTFDDVYSGESFHVGAFRFEVKGTTELPQAPRRGLSADPAGPIDLSVLDDKSHIAPRWRANEAPSPKPIGLAERAEERAVPAPDQGKEPGERPSFSPVMRIVLLGMICLLGGYLLYDFTRPPPPSQPRLGNFADTDLMAAVKEMGCDSDVECRERAKDSYRIARVLLRSSSHDLVTLYKIVRHLHRTRLAIGANRQNYPELDALYERTGSELKVVFADTAFLYERALTEQHLKEQKSILLLLMHLCTEERHVFCAGLENVYLSFADGS